MTEFAGVVTVQESGKNGIRASIPLSLKEELGLSVGDKVFVYRDGERIIFTKKAIVGDA